MISAAAAWPRDSFTPISLTTTIAPVQHVGTRVPISVKVTADPGILDIRDSLLKVEVALASECDGTFAQTETHGVVLMNRPLTPQPAAGKAYDATAATTFGAPVSTGAQTVCVWLVQQSDQRVYASDQSIGVTVEKALGRHASKPRPKQPKPTVKRA